MVYLTFSQPYFVTYFWHLKKLKFDHHPVSCSNRIHLNKLIVIERGFLLKCNVALAFNHREEKASARCRVS